MKICGIIKEMEAFYSEVYGKNVSGEDAEGY
jgi:hypothetical protein